MTEALSLEFALEVMFAGRTPDAHASAARKTFQALAQAFPNAGLALTGSVARGKHRRDSDVDILVVDEAFQRDLQLSAEVDGVGVAVIGLRARNDAGRERRWYLQVGGEVRLVLLVRSAVIVRDPSRALAHVRSLADAAWHRRTDISMLRAALRQEALEAADVLRSAPPATASRAALRLGLVLLEIALVDHGAVGIEDKTELNRARNAAVARDPALAAVLRNAARPEGYGALLETAARL